MVHFYITITLPNLHFTPTRASFPYRFSRKERLDRAELPLYDFGARWYNTATISDWPDTKTGAHGVSVSRVGL